MKERPILFSGEMVRAILDGRKTQTRRVVKPQPCEAGFAAQPFNWSRVEKVGTFFHIISDEPSAQFTVRCPYGAPGDKLWVKETWVVPSLGGLRVKAPYIHAAYNYDVIYAADDGRDHFPAGRNWTQRNADFKWRPSIHMPRWASRITLEIVSVRVERVQAISEGDAKAEGVPCEIVFDTDRGIDGRSFPIREFQMLWDSINEDRGFEWDANPWVWAIEFKLIGKEAA